jgi:hypothetical protein
MIRTPLEATVAALSRTLASAEVKAADLTAILLVGGSARIPLVSTMLGDAFPCPVLLDAHPQRCVALGAALLAGSEPKPAGAGSVTTAVSAPIPAPVGPNRNGGRARALVAVAVAIILAGIGVVTALALRPDHHDGASGLSPDPISTTVIGGFPDGAAATATSAPSVTSAKATAKKHRSVASSPTRSAAKAGKAAKSAKSTKPGLASVGRTPAATSMAGKVGALVGVAGECADVGNAMAIEDNLVQLYACNQSAAQIWTVTSSNTIQAMNMCLTAAGPVTGMQQQSSPAVIDTCNNTKAQQWKFVSGALINQGLHTCLGELGGATVDRTPLITQACSGSAGQKWHM